MGRSTLYGVDKNNALTEIDKINNGMAACFPIWNYLDKKYFPNAPFSFSEKPCWKLTPQQTSKEEYFTLLTSFDGYYFTKEHLPEMIELLKKTHLRPENPIKSTRLEIFEKALQDTEFDKFFITATSVADYEMFIDEHYDEELDDYTSAPTLKDTTWNLWDEYITNINNLDTEN